MCGDPGKCRELYVCVVGRECVCVQPLVRPTVWELWGGCVCGPVGPGTGQSSMGGPTTMCRTGSGVYKDDFSRRGA